MILFVNLIILISQIIERSLTSDVCTPAQCTCEAVKTIVKCDSKGWTNLDAIEFPADVRILTLIGNELNFYKTDDRSKIEGLLHLENLNLNKNPLGTIPSFNLATLQHLSMQDTVLSSAEFPSCYLSSTLKTISLNDNKIRSINESNFSALKASRVTVLSIDNAALSKIDQNAFAPLAALQSLSLQNNQLKSCEFLSALRVLESIKLDGNQFSALPQQLLTGKSIKSYFFRNNLISTIDESSPLKIWLRKNYTNVIVYLANNPFDCCQSLWFIQFLNSSAHYVGDAPLLTCATPLQYFGKKLLALDPNEMNCGGVEPDGSWWTIPHIVAVIVGSFTTLTLLFVTIFITRQRQQQYSRSGYAEIAGANDLAPSSSLLSAKECQSAVHVEIHDDDNSTYSTAYAE